MNKENILIIDDELAPRESIRMVLKDKYAVSTATGAHEGLDMMLNQPVDLVVMDIKMPKMPWNEPDLCSTSTQNL